MPDVIAYVQGCYAAALGLPLWINPWVGFPTAAARWAEGYRATAFLVPPRSRTTASGRARPAWMRVVAGGRS